MKAWVGCATGQVGALIRVSPRSLGCRLAIAVVAAARVRARGVGAGRITPTNIEGGKRALVDIDASNAMDIVVVDPAGGASTCKRPDRVAARCVSVTVVARRNTLVDVGACSARTSVSSVACARERPGNIAARGKRIAVVSPTCALVDFHACCP